MNMMQNRNYWFSSGYLITFYAAWSLWWSFYAIWLKSKIGLSGEQLGIVYAANSAAAMCFMIFYGIIQDRQSGNYLSKYCYDTYWTVFNLCV